MEFKDYYGILGVSKEAPQEEIRKAFRELARTYHPDRNEDPGAEEKFKEINEANDVLRDPEKRARYDAYGMAWKAAQEGRRPSAGFGGVRFDFDPSNVDFSNGGGGEFGSFFDLLEHLFGGARRASGSRTYSGGFGGLRAVSPRMGSDHEARVSLSLEEAAQGGKRRIALTDPDTGKSRTYRVAIPKGVRSGQRIRLVGQGGQGPKGATSGDLYLILDIRPHDRFERKGRDLYAVLPVAPWKAALGGSVRMRTLNETVKIKIPPGSSSGRRVRLKGKGFPDPEGAGDLYVEIRIVVPEALSGEERALYEKLASVSSETV